MMGSSPMGVLKNGFEKTTRIVKNRILKDAHRTKKSKKNRKLKVNTKDKRRFQEIILSKQVKETKLSKVFITLAIVFAFCLLMMHADILGFMLFFTATFLGLFLVIHTIILRITSNKEIHNKKSHAKILNPRRVILKEEKE